MYAVAMFGYVSATLATFSIGQDADDDDAEIAGARAIEALQDEIVSLQTEIQSLRRDDL